MCILNSLNEDDCNLKITNSMSVFQVKINQGITKKSFPEKTNILQKGTKLLVV